MPRPSTARSPLGPVRSLLRDTRAATAVEYGLILALIALGTVGAMSRMGVTLIATFDTISSYLLATR